MRIERLLLVLLILTLHVSAAFAQNRKPVEGWASLDGVKIRYLDVGDRKAKDALVFVHCWTCNVDFWRDNINGFPSMRVIAMDLPGHGASDKPKIEYSMEMMARSVEAVMNKAGVRRAVLAGHSMGTPIVRRFYELHPDKTLGLVIVDGALVPFGPRQDVEKFFEPMFKDYRPGAATFIDGMLQSARPNVRPFIRSSMLATPEHVAVSAMRKMLDDAYAPHGTISVPVLAVMAPTAFWPKDLEAQYRAKAPDLDFQMWSGVSHFLQLEEPAKFNAAVNAFIAKKNLLPTKPS
jgi:pimeloyl-ACP methyl ester carboxylesterase